MHTILCIDDDPVFADLYRSILEPKGYAFLYADNPADGHKTVLKKCPSLILLDVMMPESGGFRDGFDLLERLRKETSCKDTPIVMVSAIGGEDDAQHGKELGANGYIPKQELSPQRLLETIADLLNAKTA